MSQSSTQKSGEQFEQDPLTILNNDAMNIAIKIKYSILVLAADRNEAVQRLRVWDLWGPLVACLLLVLSIGIPANEKYTYDSFVNVFLIFWIGSFLASINIRLLGNKASLFQSISIIGYCMFPIALVAVFIAILPNSTYSIIKVLIVTAGLIWASLSCLIVMRQIVSEAKQILSAYPIILLYIFLAWYAIVT